jgi:hypothetical protein
MGGYLGTPAVPYDELHGSQDLPIAYFTARGQGDIHLAWKWLRYIVTLEDAPTSTRQRRLAEAAYARHSGTLAFDRFCAWMGDIERPL